MIKTSLLSILNNVIVDKNLVYLTGKYVAVGAFGNSKLQNSDGIRIANELADLSHGDATPFINNIQVTNNLLHGFAAGDIYYSAAGGGQFNNATSNGILLKGSHSLANTFIVYSTFGVPNPTYTVPAPATTTYEIDGGLKNA